MEPVSLIMGALTAGAVRGVGDSASDAVKCAYGGLVSALKRALSRNSVALTAVDEYGTAPERFGPVIEASLAQLADLDQASVAAAIEVLRHADPDGFATGKYMLSLPGAKGVQVNYSGGNIQNNRF